MRIALSPGSILVLETQIDYMEMPEFQILWTNKLISNPKFPNKYVFSYLGSCTCRKPPTVPNNLKKSTHWRQTNNLITPILRNSDQLNRVGRKKLPLWSNIDDQKSLAFEFAQRHFLPIDILHPMIHRFVNCNSIVLFFTVKSHLHCEIMDAARCFGTDSSCYTTGLPQTKQSFILLLLRWPNS